MRRYVDSAVAGESPGWWRSSASGASNNAHRGTITSEGSLADQRLGRFQLMAGVCKLLSRVPEYANVTLYETSFMV